MLYRVSKNFIFFGCTPQNDSCTSFLFIFGVLKHCFLCFFFHLNLFILLLFNLWGGETKDFWLNRMFKCHLARTLEAFFASHFLSSSDVAILPVHHKQSAAALRGCRIYFSIKLKCLGNKNAQRSSNKNFR